MNSRREQQIIKQFGKKLREIRESKGLSLRELADLADMNHGNIHEIEQGRVNPSIATAALLAEALGIDPGDLFPR